MADHLAHEFQLRRAELEIQGATDIEAVRELALRMLRLLETQSQVFNQMVKAGWLDRPPH